MSALISWCVGGATIVHQAGLRRPCLVTAFCFLLLRTATGPATHTAGLYSATAALTPERSPSSVPPVPTAPPSKITCDVTCSPSTSSTSLISPLISCQDKGFPYDKLPG